MHRLLLSFCDRRRHTLWRRQFIAALLAACLFLQSATAVAPQPGWWSAHSVLDPNAVADDFAAANIGQLKYIATKAAAAMNATLPEGAGDPINDLITSWSQPPLEGVVRDDYSALTQGQLKSVAQLFYDRLGLDYPWAGGEALKDDELWVNLGQLKHVFSFELRTFSSTPGFAAAEAAAQASWTLLDEEERPENSSLDDLDGDGIPNIQEYRMGHGLFDPADIDGDRILDADEDDYPGVLSKLRFADAVEDPDDSTGDGVMNYEELLLELDPSVGNSSGASGINSDADVLLLAFQRGGPLTHVSDPLMATWLILDEAWFTAHGLNVENYYGHWLEPDGFTDFATEFWVVSMGYGGYYSEDHDWDGIPNLWEYRYELNLHDASDAQADPDSDSLTNYEEYLNGTNPLLADTDGDGFNDGVEVDYGGDPTQPSVAPSVRLTQVSSPWLSVSAGMASASLMVRAMQGDLPCPGVGVTFQINTGPGLLAGGGLRAGNAAATTGATVTLTTGANGVATASYLAPASPGSASVTASLVTDSAESATFSVNVLSAPVVSGDPSGGPAAPISGQPQADIDKDGIPDDWEVAHGLFPNVSNADTDYDGDTYSDLEEYVMESDPMDPAVHPGPVIKVRRKTYSSNYEEFRWDAESPLQKRFYGETGLSGGADYLYIPQEFNEGHPVNMPDSSSSIYSAFKDGSYEGDALDFNLGRYGDYVWTVASRTNSPLGFSKQAGGEAIQLRVMPGGFGTAAPRAWSRTYLVAEYQEPVGEGTGYLSTMPLKRVLGTLQFSTDDKGSPSIAIQGNFQGQVHPQGNDSVEIMPRQEEGQAIKIAVMAVKLLSDLNNDGKLNNSDAALACYPYAVGATDAKTNEGTEFMFANDQLSNGAWDNEDSVTPGVPATSADDDAEELDISPGIVEGEIWLHHPAIGGLKFYDSQRCDHEISFSPGSPFVASLTNPCPSKIFVRAETVEFSAEHRQVDGNLKLMVKPAGIPSDAVEISKIKLAIVQKVGASKHHLAALDYIDENNATHMTRYLVGSTRPESRYAVMVEDRTAVVGINAKPDNLTGIDLVIASPKWKNNTVIVNCSYSGTNVSDGDFFDKHNGKLFHDYTWDSTCSIASTWGVGVAGHLGHAGKIKTVFGVEDLPPSLPDGATKEGSGGLPMSPPGSSTWNCFAKITVRHFGRDESMLISAVYGHDTSSPEYVASNFDYYLQQGSSVARVYWGDAGGSFGHAIASPDGTLIQTAAAARHGFLGRIFNECIKTYLGFKCKRPRGL